MTHILKICLSVVFAITLSQTTQAQQDTKQTIFRQAGNYSAKHDVLAIAVLRGTIQKVQYDRFIDLVSQKLDSMKVPHKFFQEFNSNEGTSFDYFIENDMNGSFNANELYALLPHIHRRFREQYNK